LECRVLALLVGVSAAARDAVIRTLRRSEKQLDVADLAGDLLRRKVFQAGFIRLGVRVVQSIRLDGQGPFVDAGDDTSAGEPCAAGATASPERVNSRVARCTCRSLGTGGLLNGHP